MNPLKDALVQFFHRPGLDPGLKNHFRIGGSLLLQNLGMEIKPRDLDLVCFLSRLEIEPFLQGITYQEIPRGEIYLSSFLIKFELGGIAFDLIGSFAVKAQRTGLRIAIDPKTLAEAIDATAPGAKEYSLDMEGVSFSDPYSWREVYRHLGRDRPVAFLDSILPPPLARP